MTDFEVMQKMVEQNLDIKSEGAVLDVGVGRITMVIDEETANKLHEPDNKYQCMLYIINMEDFKKVKYNL